ncbi:hypothetical protein HK096_003066, partial [Nowakowskiella sp. JEL0078]
MFATLDQSLASLKQHLNIVAPSQASLSGLSDSLASFLHRDIPMYSFSAASLHETASPAASATPASVPPQHPLSSVPPTANPAGASAASIASASSGIFMSGSAFSTVKTLVCLALLSSLSNLSSQLSRLEKPDRSALPSLDDFHRKFAAKSKDALQQATQKTPKKSKIAAVSDKNLPPKRQSAPPPVIPKSIIINQIPLKDSSSDKNIVSLKLPASFKLSLILKDLDASKFVPALPPSTAVVAVKPSPRKKKIADDPPIDSEKLTGQVLGSSSAISSAPQLITALVASDVSVRKGRMPNHNQDKKEPNIYDPPDTKPPPDQPRKRMRSPDTTKLNTSVVPSPSVAPPPQIVQAPILSTSQTQSTTKRLRNEGLEKDRSRSADGRIPVSTVTTRTDTVVSVSGGVNVNGGDVSVGKKDVTKKDHISMKLKTKSPIAKRDLNVTSLTQKTAAIPATRTTTSTNTATLKKIDTFDSMMATLKPDSKNDTSKVVTRVSEGGVRASKGYRSTDHPKRAREYGAVVGGVKNDDDAMKRRKSEEGSDVESSSGTVAAVRRHKTIETSRLSVTNPAKEPRQEAVQTLPPPQATTTTTNSLVERHDSAMKLEAGEILLDEKIPLLETNSKDTKTKRDEHNRDVDPDKIEPLKRTTSENSSLEDRDIHGRNHHRSRTDKHLEMPKRLSQYVPKYNRQSSSISRSRSRSKSPTYNTRAAASRSRSRSRTPPTSTSTKHGSASHRDKSKSREYSRRSEKRRRSRSGGDKEKEKRGRRVSRRSDSRDSERNRRGSHSIEQRHDDPKREDGRKVSEGTVTTSLSTSTPPTLPATPVATDSARKVIKLSDYKRAAESPPAAVVASALSSSTVVVTPTTPVVAAAQLQSMTSESRMNYLEVATAHKKLGDNFNVIRNNELRNLHYFAAVLNYMLHMQIFDE